MFQNAHPALQAALDKRGYTTPTSVQAAVLAADAERDLLVSAQTGSGKTVAFGLALARTLLAEEPKFGPAGAPLALVVAPTRELALQVQRELQWLFAETGARVATCVGGMDPRRERYDLDRGVHIVVGTPGRLVDHLDRGSLILARCGIVVLDEADEMLDMGFREDLEKLLTAAPAERRTLMFSATIPPDIAQLAKRYQKQVQRVAAAGEGEVHRDIKYEAMVYQSRERDLVVVNVLRLHEAAGALVFCATRDGVTRLAANLAERGFAVTALSGELTQRERNTALQALRDGRSRVCVATDVAARGLDLPDLGLVIHADLPQNGQVLVHRSGRTGRAGKSGLAILLVAEPGRRYADRMFRDARIQAQWVPPPSAEAIAERDRERIGVEVGELSEEVTAEDRLAARSILATRPAEDLVAALVRLRRVSRPAAEELTPPRPPRQERDNRPANRPPPRGPNRDAGPGPGPGPGRNAPPSGNGAWFTINVGRNKNADPKWLIPLLCRRGEVGKNDIGKIQILGRETRVEINPAAAARFTVNVRRPDDKDRNIHIEPLDAA